MIKNKNDYLKLTKFNCFSSLKLDNKEKKEIHSIIQEDKKFLLNYFDKQPCFKEIMPLIKSVHMRNNFHSKIPQNVLRRESTIFHDTKKINEEKESINPKIIKKIKFYNMPEIELLKLKKKNIENINTQKIQIKKIEKDNFEKYKQQVKKLLKSPFSSSMINLKRHTIDPKLISSSNLTNFNQNSMSSNNNTNNSFLNNANSTGRITQNFILNFTNKDLSTNYISIKNFNNEVKNLINKCKEEIRIGNKVEGIVSNYEKKISKTIKRKLKVNKIINKDKKIIEDKKIKKNKYIKQEENNYLNIKKKMNEKISNSLAYHNRKKLNKILKVNVNVNAYVLHLNEMNKINEKMDKKRKIEMKRINKVENLCEEGFRKKEYLKNTLDILNKKHQQLNQTMDFIPYNDYDVNKNKNHLRGTLLPKIISMKKDFKKSYSMGNSLEKNKESH